MRTNIVCYYLLKFLEGGFGWEMVYVFAFRDFLGICLRWMFERVVRVFEVGELEDLVFISLMGR